MGASVWSGGETLLNAQYLIIEVMLLKTEKN
jgi:hypothetical protein